MPARFKEMLALSMPRRQESVPMQEQQTFDQILRGEIKAEMARQDVTQRELSQRLGWQQSALSRRLAGKLDLTITELEQIAAALEVPVTQFGWQQQQHPIVRRVS